MAAPLHQKARRTNGDSHRSTAPVVSTPNGSTVLPQDLLYEILVRLPVKPLCRLRAVCRPWRSLLSNSSFVAAHGARHGPLVAAFKRETVGVHILNMSGHTVGHVGFEDYLQNHYATNMACTSLDLFCFMGADKRPRVIDPATGVVSPLPDDPQIDHKSPYTVFAIGRAYVTGEAKVLAVDTWSLNASSCKVLTLTLGGAGKWRETGCAPTLLVNSSRWMALVKGVLYFGAYDHDNIAAYDLETETWWPDLLHFPLQLKGKGDTLVELSDSLVAVHKHKVGQKGDLFMDLWFLTDPENVLWSKRYTVTMPYQGFPRGCYASTGRPLWALDNEKIVFWVSHYLKDNKEIRVVHLLRVYDPRTNTYTDEAEMTGYIFAGVYKQRQLKACWSSTDQELSGYII